MSEFSLFFLQNDINCPINKRKISSSPKITPRWKPRYLLLTKSPVNLVSMFSRPLVWNKAVMSKKFRVLFWGANTVPGKVKDRIIRFRCSAALSFVIKQSKNFNSQINPWLCRGKAKRPRELDLFVVFLLIYRKRFFACSYGFVCLNRFSVFKNHRLPTVGTCSRRSLCKNSGFELIRCFVSPFRAPVGEPCYTCLLRAASDLRFLLMLGFSYLACFLISDKIPAFWIFFLNLFKAFSILSFSPTLTSGICFSPPSGYVFSLMLA